ncbi:hypothetical protein [Bizionia paragorgiae]|uniref:hypothetical protein n=1 Tax=Bizionia paragorgiae TaxID=283786 RepID=UPI003A8F3335
MNKILLLPLIFIFIGCGTPRSQLKGHCKLKIDTVDEFTKKRILQTREESFTISGMGLGTSTYVYSKKVDEKTYLIFHIVSPSAFSIHEGNNIMLLFKDDSVLEIPFENTEIADFTYIDGIGSIWSVRSYFELPENEIQILKEKKVKKLRIYFSDSYFEDDVKELRQDNIASVLKCIEAYQ